jgi:diketogulonate reductase-like aldo/keto reductase
MKTAPFGPARIELPVIGQGTWDLERTSERQAIAVLQTGLDAGMIHIDTAEMYGSGRVERIVGHAIQGRRDEVFLVSKVLPVNASYKDTIVACDRSLKQLGTDYLDVYLLHWRGNIPLMETFSAFEQLKANGKIKSYGVSNFDVNDLEEAIAITGEDRIVCNQVLYHLTERSIEHAVIPCCRRHDVAMVAYSPFGSGSFPSPRSAGGRVLAAIAKKRRVSTHQIALAFLVQQSGVFAIPKTADKAHVLDNAAAGDLELTASEINEIAAAFPVKHRRDLPML